MATSAHAVTDTELRTEAADFGMWIFLTTETLFFGVLFFGYLISRIHFSAVFAAASRHTDLLLGTLNTGVLLTSSLTMAFAAANAESARKRPASRLLAATAVLGVAFLAIKAFEYYVDYAHHLVPGIDFAFAAPHAVGAAAFFWWYFAMTGTHALHLLIGIVIVLVMVYRLHRATRTDASLSLQITGLYWHFVDVMWIFLYPCLYLVART